MFQAEPITAIGTSRAVSIASLPAKIFSRASVCGKPSSVLSPVNPFSAVYAFLCSKKGLTVSLKACTESLVAITQTSPNNYF